MKRRSITLPVILFVMLMAQRAAAQDYRMAAGIRLSNNSPTLASGLSGKFFATDKTAIEAIVAWGNHFGVGALLEIHNKINTPGLSWFYGAGAYFGSGNNTTYFGPTGIIGLDYKFTGAPINLSLDWKPELDLSPDINFIPDAFALTVRFAFK